MAIRTRKPSAIVLSQRAARSKRNARKQVEIDWFIDRVSKSMSLTIRQRVTIAAKFLADRVTKNISRPVTVSTGPRGGRVVTDRSKPGEFPKADTKQLMRTIFFDVKRVRKDVYDGFVGTPLDYGLILETRMDREFLQRTLREEMIRIRRIVTARITKA